MRTNQFNNLNNGDRVGVTNLAIIITNGPSAPLDTNTIQQAYLAKVIIDSVQLLTWVLCIIIFIYLLK